jgi:hypothetical protein
VRGLMVAALVLGTVMAAQKPHTRSSDQHGTSSSALGHSKKPNISIREHWAVRPAEVGTAWCTITPDPAVSLRELRQEAN